MKLTRESVGLPAAPIRIVHIGVGAFHRAHQAWFTEKVDVDREWGIVAFTGRSPNAAQELTAQECLYTLITRGNTEDTFEVIGQISLAEDINRLGALIEQIANPNVSLVTLTITESGYTTAPDGPLWKLAEAIEHRRQCGGGPLTIISCDNITKNGERTRSLLMEIDLGERYLEFLRNDVGFISTSVDRITPRTTQQDVELTLQSTGWEDSIPVVTEPFASWVLSGEFLSERPKWEDAGALFVEDIEVYENRKLWLLNGAHSYLAYRGINRGFETVSEAISDPEVYKEVVDLWSEATPHIPLEVSEYVNDLLARFQNERISHRLEQVAQDGLLKLQMRCSQVVLQNLSEGNLPHSYARLFAEWIAYVKSSDYKDSRRELIESASSVPDYLALINLELSNSRALVELIESLLSKTKGVKC